MIGQFAIVLACLACAGIGCVVGWLRAHEVIGSRVEQVQRASDVRHADRLARLRALSERVAPLVQADLVANGEDGRIVQAARDIYDEIDDEINPTEEAPDGLQ